MNLKKSIITFVITCLILMTFTSCNRTTPNKTFESTEANTPTEDITPTEDFTPTDDIELMEDGDSDHSDDLSNYINKYIREIDVEEKFPDGLFDSDENYRVFLTGEEHARLKSYQMKKNMLMYFYEEYGTRYILCETGIGTGIVLEEYIQNGDEDLLNMFMRLILKTVSYTKEEEEFWRWLYEYNQSLPENDKLHIIGVDLDFQRKTAIKGLSLLIDTTKTPDESIATVVDQLEQVDPLLFDSFPELLEEHQEAFIDLFGNNYVWAEQLSRSFQATNEFRAHQSELSNDRSYDLRDKFMMENFLFALEQFPEAIFFGQFGAEHIYQSACETLSFTANYQRFGMLLNKEGSPVQNQVCSILYIYDNNLQTQYVSFDIFEPLFKKDYMLSLNEEDSPFLKENYFMLDENAGATSLYYQKLILLNKAGYSTRYQ